MPQSTPAKTALQLLMEASNRAHRIEMQTLLTEITRIKQTFIKKHGRP